MMAPLVSALEGMGQAVALRQVASDQVDLHLRDAGLTPSQAQALAEALLEACQLGMQLRSLSVSYNPNMGDSGALALIQALPPELEELGMVGCALGAPCGEALLSWASAAPTLRMMCVEENAFPTELRQALLRLGRPGRLVIC